MGTAPTSAAFIAKGRSTPYLGPDYVPESPAALRGRLRETTLAKALCHNPKIQNAFDDGILWVTLGETPRDSDRSVADLIYTLSGALPGFTNPEASITTAGD
jgi:hypothetical protein